MGYLNLVTKVSKSELKHQINKTGLMSARNSMIKCLGPESYVTLCSGSYSLSGYLQSTDKSIYYSRGSLRTTKYIIPLHVISVVPSQHRVKKLAVSRTDTTVNYIEVVVSCMVESIATKPYTGSIHLSEYIDKVVKAMNKNEFLPFTPSIEVLNSTSDLSMMAPLTLGNKCSVSGLSSCSLDVDFNGVIYSSYWMWN